MPEFIMQGRDAIASESAFVQGFIEALLFTETSPVYDSENWFSEETQKAIEEGQSDGTIPTDIGADSLTAEAIAFCRKLCVEFQEKAAPLLALAYERDDYDESQAGRDFLYTRLGHGVGYWDRAALRATEEDSAEYERLTQIMIANRANADAWGKALAQRKEIEARGLGNQLTALCGNGELLPYWDGAKLHISGY